ncbi:hypothetical protein GvMRE_IIg551 [endosymbiont GvMRE of Glomus versiforme]|nr:hypothetical protein GvMRE_IIg551 [endosymbiont GvMRE of Glomus versiforme]
MIGKIKKKLKFLLKTIFQKTYIDSEIINSCKDHKEEYLNLLKKNSQEKDNNIFSLFLANHHIIVTTAENENNGM